jgi:hypothetical protein
MLRGTLVAVIRGFITVALLAAAAAAEDLTADEIARRSREAAAMGLVSGRAEIRLVVTDSGGARERLIQAAALRQGEETRRLVRFRAPAEVAGVAFLQIERDGKNPQRLLWLPAQKRVRRVGAGQGGQAFMQTDFSYSDLDLAGGSGEKHERLDDAEVEEQPCYVLSTTAPGSPYRRVVTFIHKETFVALRVEFHGEDAPVKTLRVKRLKQVGGRFYATEQVMERADGRSKTELFVTSIEPDAAVAADELSERALERG